MALKGGFRGIVDIAITSGGPTQDLVLPNNIANGELPKGCLIWANSVEDIGGSSHPNKKLSYGFTDGVTEAGIYAFQEDNTASSNGDNASFTDALIKIPSDDGTSLVAVAVFDSWIPNGIRINWTTFPTVAHKLHVVLWAGDDMEVSVGIVSPGPDIGTTQLENVGFEPDHLITCSINATAFPVSQARVYTYSLAQAIRTGAATQTTRVLCPNETASAIVAAPTEVFSDVSLTRSRSNVSPYNYNDRTQLDSTTPWDVNGFNVEGVSEGGSQTRGSALAYMAIKYPPGMSFVIQEIVTPGTLGVVKYTTPFRPQAMFGFQTLMDVDWVGDVEYDTSFPPQCEVDGLCHFSKNGIQFSTTQYAQQGTTPQQNSSLSSNTALVVATIEPTVDIDYLANVDATGKDNGFEEDGFRLNYTAGDYADARVSLFILEDGALVSPECDLEHNGVGIQATGNVKMTATAVLPMLGTETQADGNVKMTATATLPALGTQIQGTADQAVKSNATLPALGVGLQADGVVRISGDAVLPALGAALASDGNVVINSDVSLAMQGATLASTGALTYPANVQLPNLGVTMQAQGTIPSLVILGCDVEFDASYQTIVTLDASYDKVVTFPATVCP